MEILGTRGLITLGELKGKSTVIYTKKNGGKMEIVDSWTHLFKEAYINEDISFIQTVLNDREPEVTGKDGLMAVKVVNAGNKSIVTGEIVKL